MGWLVVLVLLTAVLAGAAVVTARRRGRSGEDAREDRFVNPTRTTPWRDKHGEHGGFNA